MSRLKIVRKGSTEPFFHLHAHSGFSAQDGIGTVEAMVARAHELGQPALALTDHGNMAGAVRLYRECRKLGLKPFPGCEIYFVPDRTDKKAKRHHLGLVAYTTEGYHNLVRLISTSHQRDHFHHKPLLDWADFGALDTSGIALLTGCYYGLVQQAMESAPLRPAMFEMMAAAEAEMRTLMGLFSPVIVEQQLHEIEHDNGMPDYEYMDAIDEVAQKLGLPTACTQDSHYPRLSDQDVHDAMKRIVSWGDDPDDATFPGDGFHLASTGWMRERHKELWDTHMETFEWLLDNHDLVIPELEKYSYKIPHVAKDPDMELTLRATRAMGDLGLGRKREYIDRLHDELGIVQDTGMAGYLLLVAEVTDWCTKHGVIFQARGSASGSILCWLLGITQTDPIKYKLRFERFISRDRTKPPDIDLDVQQSRRQELIDWLSGRYHVTQIGTWRKLGINPPDHPKEPGQGSLVVKWNAMRKRANPQAGYLRTIDLIERHAPEDARLLRELDSYKIYDGPGTHAAGMIVTDDGARIEQIVPTMLIASSNTTVTQFDMDDDEALGLVKLDVLGLRTLDTMQAAVRMLGWSDPAGLEAALSKHIKLSDSKTYTMLRNGKTSGVFQLEGGTSARGCREVGVRNIHDIIAVLALYRPATMISGTTDEYVQRKHGLTKVPTRHSLLHEHIGDTYGLFVYQEQIISVCRSLGFDPEDLTSLIKIIKVSQKHQMAKAAIDLAGYEAEFHDRASDAGMRDRDRKFTWDSITGFTGYGFNRAHATAYGLTSYRTAYLKMNHGLEYASALLETTSGTKKETQYERTVRREMGFRLLKPDVNVSGARWTIDRKKNAVRRGLMSIKGVGEKAAVEIEANAPFTTIEDLIERCAARAVNGGKGWATSQELTGTMKHLRNAGALRSLGVAPEDD